MHCNKKQIVFKVCLWSRIYILKNPFAGFIVSIIKSQFPFSGSVHLCNNGGIFLAHLAYHCRSWQRRCEKSCRWTARAYCRPRSAAPGWWRWRGLGESRSTCHTETHYKWECESLSSDTSTSVRCQTQAHNSHVQHVGVCELHKQIFVLEHSCKDTNVFFGGRGHVCPKYVFASCGD